MRKLIIISLFIIGLSLSSAGKTWEVNSAPASKPLVNPNQWALLIGVGDYPGNTVDLKYPGADASSIKDLLISSAGYAEDHVRLLTDNGAGETRATKQNIFTAIDQYLAPRVQPGHEIIIFLAGHGIVNGVGTEAKSYFLPVDTDIQAKETVARTAVDMEELISKRSALKASQFTLFYDACREDPSPGRGFKGNQLTDVTARILTLVPSREQQQRRDAPTSVVFYACQIGERAFESSQLQHGVFTYYILRGLRELADRPDGRVEAGRLAGYLSENVRKWSQEAKNPFGQNQNPTMVATDVRGPVLVARVLPLSGNVPETTAVSGIRLNTFPEDATISINGQQAGRGPFQKDLPPNQYTVRAESPGFQPSETRINVIAGYRQEITINLQSSAGNSNYEKGIQFERQKLLPQAITAYQQALAEDPNSESVYESLAQVYVKSGRYREAVDLLLVAEQKFPNNALILARRSRAQSAMKLDEADLVASVGQTGETQPDEGSGKKSKKGKAAKKSKNKNEEAFVSSGSESLTPQPEEESGKKSKKGKKSKNKNEQAFVSPESESLTPQPEEESGKKSKKGKKSKNKNEQAFAPPPGSQSLAPQSNEASGEESGKKSKKSGKKDKGAEAQSGVEDQGGKDGKKSKSGKGGKNSDKESSQEAQASQIQGAGIQDADIQGRRLAGPMAPEVQEKGAAKSCDLVRDAELAIQKDSGLAEAHRALGFALLAVGKDFDRAIASFVLASTLAPEDAEAYFGAGYAYRLNQQSNLAVPQLKKAIELRPDYYEAKRELANCYLSTGATDLAIKQYVVAISYRAATNEASEYAANNLALGALYRKKGDQIGGVQGEEYRLTGKACEDDARKEEPDLRRAVKLLAAAGILKFVAANAPPEIRKLMQEFIPPDSDPSGLNAKTPPDAKIPTGNLTSKGAAPTPCNCGQTVYVPVPVAPNPEKSPKNKKDKGKKIKPEKDDNGPTFSNPPINFGGSVIIPIGPRRPRPAPSDYPRDYPKNPGRDRNPGRNDYPGGNKPPGRNDYPGGNKPPRGDSGSSTDKPPSNRPPGGVIIGRPPSRIGIRPNIQVVKPPPPRQVIR
jgi:tetratricopeptide (TPR) repeat protein